MDHGTVFMLLLSGYVLAATVILCYLLPFFFIRLAHAKGFLDYPSPGLKNHSRPVPFLGGVSIFLGFWSIVLVGILLARIFSHNALVPDTAQKVLSAIVYLFPKIGGIFLGSLVIHLVGLFDDRFKWTPVQKLLGQVTAAVILMRMGLAINLFSNFGVWGYAVTFVWILLMMNAFNFIDSLDGHCAGVALISSLTLTAITGIIHQPLVNLFLVTFSGALIGFLPHNFKPAKIFLGDNGSLFIGYMMAAFTLLCNYHSPATTTATVFIPLLVFGVPIYDTVSVITIRLARGIAPWRGDRNHFAHRLVKIGMSDKIAVIFSYFISVTMGLVAVLTTQVDLFGAVLIGLIFFSVIGVIAFLEFYVTKTIRISEMLAKKKHRRREDTRAYFEQEDQGDAGGSKE